MGKSNGGTRSSSAGSPQGLSEASESIATTSNVSTRPLSFRAAVAQRARANETLERAASRLASSLGSRAEVDTITENSVSFYEPSARDRAGLRNEYNAITRDNISEYENSSLDYQKRLVRVARQLFDRYPNIRLVALSREV